MNIWQRIGSLLNPETSSPVNTTAGLRQLIDRARRSKLAEHYSDAVEALTAAKALAEGTHDSAGIVVILLQEADIHLRQGRFEEALKTLETARTHANGQPVQLAYILLQEGMVAYAQGQPDQAQKDYEHALQLGRESKSPGAEGRAQGLRAEIYLAEGNASYASHLLKEALEQLNRAADIELSPLFVGLLGQADLAMGHKAEGLHRIERALKFAQELGDRVNWRRWLLVLGDHTRQDGRLLESRHYYRQIIETEPSAPASVEIPALIQLSVVSAQLRAHDDALSYAEKAVSQSRSSAPALLQQAESALGVALHAAGRSAEAVPYLRAALQQTGDKEPPILALRTLAAALVEAGAADEAAQIYQQVLKRADHSGTALEKAQVRRDFGLLHFKQGQHTEAVHLWMAAIPLFESENAHAQVARLLCDLGNARKLQGLHQRALRDYEQALIALNAVDAHDLETQGLVRSNAANAYAEQGDSDTAEGFFSEAIALAEKSGDAAAESTRRSNFAYFLVQIGRPRRAIAMLEQALDISRARGMTLATAIQLSNLGLAYLAANEPQEALKTQQLALTEIQKLDQPFWETSIQINLAQAELAARGDIDAAESRITDALARAQSLQQTDLIVRAAVAKAEIALKQGDGASVHQLLDDIIPIARKSNLQRWLADALRVLSEQEAAENRLESAREHWSEAARYYHLLRMPQGKKAPAWYMDDPA